MQANAAAQRDLEEAKKKLEHWQVLIELLTDTSGFRVEFNPDRTKIKIISDDAQKTASIAGFFETLTPEVYQQTRAYQVQAANATPTLASLLPSAPVAAYAPRFPHAPEINDLETAIQIFAGMFESSNFVFADLALMFSSEDSDKPRNVSRFEHGKLYSRTMEKKYIGVVWSQILQNIYNTFNNITLEQAREALFDKPLKFQELDLEGKEISTLLTQCFYMYPTHNDTRLCMVIDFTRLTQLLWAPHIEQTQEQREYIATIDVQALAAFLRGVCGRQLYDIRDIGGTHLQVSPVILSNAPTIHLGTDLILIGDCSGSMSGSIQKMLDEMYRLRNALMREFPSATLQVIFFNDNIIFRKKYPSIRGGDLERDLTAAKINSSGSTALYNTLLNVFEEIYKSGRGQPRKTIAITLTDGEETVCNTEQTKAEGRQLLTNLMQRFVRHGRLQPACYFVGLGQYWKEELHILLAEATGGAQFKIGNIDQMVRTILSEENARKMQATQQTLRFVFKTAEQEFVHHINVVQADGPYCPQIEVPVPRGNAAFKVEMDQAQQNVIIDQNKLQQSQIRRRSRTGLLLQQRRVSFAETPRPPAAQLPVVADAAPAATQLPVEVISSPTPVLPEQLRLKAAAGINALYTSAVTIPPRLALAAPAVPPSPKEAIAPAAVLPVVPVDSASLNNAAVSGPVAPLFAGINYSDIQLGAKLGEGGFGAVYRAKWQGNEVAVKVLLAQNYSPEAVKMLIDEAEKMNRVGQCPQIVKVFGVSVAGPEKCIVMELMSGNLASLIQDKNKDVPWTLRCQFALDITRGIDYLHSHGMLHLDLKSYNVLVTADGQHVVVSDFGLSEVRTKTMNTLQFATMREIGTPLWMAPEIWKIPAEYSRAVDVYSLAMIFLELATREMPWIGAASVYAVIAEVLAGRRPAIPAVTPQRFAHLITGCWGQDPKDRKTTPEIIQVLEVFEQELKPPRP